MASAANIPKCVGLALLVSALLAGCAQRTEIPVRFLGPVVGTQGAASEAVFASPYVAANAAPDPNDSARRDLSLARGETSRFDEQAWSQPVRPDLSDAARLTVNWNSTSIGTYLYFRRPRYLFRDRLHESGW